MGLPVHALGACGLADISGPVPRESSEAVPAGFLRTPAGRTPSGSKCSITSSKADGTRSGGVRTSGEQTKKA